MDVLEAYRKIISIESTPSTGNLKVAQYCSELCKAAGMKVQLQEVTVDGKKNANLIARPSGSSNLRKKEILFQTHLDTVEPGPMGRWTKTDNNAFNAVVDGDKIYGLGTADVKLDFIAKVRALSEFSKMELKRPFVLVGTYAEEIGMLGAQQLITSGVIDPEMAIIGEPSELQICYANNGLMVLEFELPFTTEELEYFKTQNGRSNAVTQEKVFHGKAAHSSTPHLGENAILKLIEYLERLPVGVGILNIHGGSAVNIVPPEAYVELDPHVVFTSSVGTRLTNVVRELGRLGKVMEGITHPDFSPSHSTINVAVLKTGKKGIELQVSIRLTPNVSDDVIRDWIGKLQDHINALGGTCYVMRRTGASETPVDSELVQGCLEISKSLGLPTKLITKAGGTESSIYTPKGVSCIVFGPGKSLGNSHTANEYNYLSQIEKAQEFYKACARKFCL